jgi:hypothetical protein
MDMDTRKRDASPGAMSLEGMTTGLGWFSIGLGLAELLAPRAMARATGMPGREMLIQAYGLREIANGIGLLASTDPRPWLWGRVAGDALDMATLAAHAGPDNPLAGHAKAAMLLAAPIGAIDLACARVADEKAKARAGSRFDYSDRVGLARPAAAMRGAAVDFEPPPDMRTPPALRPYAAADAAPA